MNEDQELLDVVDENDEVVDTITRSNMMQLQQTPGRYLRAIDVFIQRSNGDIFLPRRSLHKKIAPGGFDASASGHIASGESYEQACIREIYEETGLSVTMDDLILIGTIPPSKILFYFRKVYILRTDQVPRLSSEHTEGLWVTPESLAETVYKDVPTKQTLDDDIPLLVHYLQKESR